MSSTQESKVGDKIGQTKLDEIVREVSLNEKQISQQAKDNDQPEFITKHPSLHLIKLDTLYKPILRRFRDFFRAKFGENYSKRAFQKWSSVQYLNNVRAFMKNRLKLPDDLMDERSVV